MTDTNDTSLRSLLRKLKELAQTDPTPRVTVHYDNPFSLSNRTAQGYIMWSQTLEEALTKSTPVNPAEHVRVMFRKNTYGTYDGYNYLRLGTIQRIESTTKDRRTGTYRRIWEPNPFVLTVEGSLDMASSLRELLGVAS